MNRLFSLMMAVRILAEMREELWQVVLHTHDGASLQAYFSLDHATQWLKKQLQEELGRLRHGRTMNLNIGAVDVTPEHHAVTLQERKALIG